MPGVFSRLREIFTTSTSAKRAGRAWPKARGSSAAFDLRRFAQAHPRWADPAELRSLTVAAFYDKPWRKLRLKKQPFFAPWHDQIQATGAPAYQLFFRPGRAGPFKSRSGGDVAYLSCPWPECGTCRRPLDLVAQIELREVSSLFKQLGSLAFFYCFQCQSRTHEELLAQLTGLIRWERPNDHPGERKPTLSPSGKTTRLRRPSRIEKRAALSFPPAATLYGPLADELFAVTLTRFKAKAREVYSKWTGSAPVRSQLAGYPCWSNDQRPKCPDCGQPMRLFLQVAGDAGFDFPGGGSAFLYFCDRRDSCPGLRDVRFVLEATESGQ